MNQARALGQAWCAAGRRPTPIHTIYASDLKRAHATAAQLTAPRAALPAAHPLACPAVRTTPLLREQHFGAAEGKRWSDGPAAAARTKNHNHNHHTHTHTSAEAGAETQESEVYFTIRNRHDKFPGGESLDDLARRAEEAVDALLWPHLDDARAYYDNARNADNSAGAGAVDGDGGEEGDVQENGEGGVGYHVVLVSHGLCISELVAAVLRRSANPGAGMGIRFKGLVNTGWTRLQIRPLENSTLDISVIAVNHAPHLVSVKRQSGGIGSAPSDEKQRSIREFFGGGASAALEPTPNDTSS